MKIITKAMKVKEEHLQALKAVAFVTAMDKTESSQQMANVLMELYDILMTDQDN